MCCVRVWGTGGPRVNWCCVLKVVNKAGEHPGSGCETHTSTDGVCSAAGLFPHHCCFDSENGWEGVRIAAAVELW